MVGNGIPLAFWRFLERKNGNFFVAVKFKFFGWHRLAIFISFNKFLWDKALKIKCNVQKFKSQDLLTKD